MSRIRTMLFVLCWQLLSGCQAQRDFGAITASFNASKTSGVSKIELIPIYVGTSLLKLSNKITITDRQTSASIVNEISFSDNPPLPKAMGHSGATAACKMLIYFQDNTVFCFYILFREGGAGAGVEYAIHPDLNFTSAYRNNLPGNHSLGRGYSIELYGILQTVIKEDREGWAKESQ